MGHKTTPLGFRVGITEEWRSRWMADKRKIPDFLLEDFRIRRLIKEKYSGAGVPRIEIERAAGQVRILLFTARPGMIIGRKGVQVDNLRDELEKITGKRVALDIQEVQRPELEAQLVAESVAEQLERRTSFRRAIKRAIEQCMAAGARGAKVQVSGRLGGSEMARSVKESRGSIPLQTLQARISYGFAEAHCPYGKIGVKAWVFLGEAEAKPVDGMRPETAAGAGRKEAAHASDA